MRSEGWTQRVVSKVAHCNRHTFLGANTHQTASHFFPKRVQTACGLTEVIFSTLLKIQLKNLQFNIRRHLIQKETKKRKDNTLNHLSKQLSTDHTTLPKLFWR